MKMEVHTILPVFDKNLVVLSTDFFVDKCDTRARLPVYTLPNIEIICKVGNQKLLLP